MNCYEIKIVKSLNCSVFQAMDFQGLVTRVFLHGSQN